MGGGIQVVDGFESRGLSAMVLLSGANNFLLVGVKGGNASCTVARQQGLPMDNSAVSYIKPCDLPKTGEPGHMVRSLRW